MSKSGLMSRCLGNVRTVCQAVPLPLCLALLTAGLTYAQQSAEETRRRSELTRTVIAQARLVLREDAGPQDRVIIRRDLKVRMRDGVHLLTDVYLPPGRQAASAAKLPTILIRTPYNKEHGYKREVDPQRYVEGGFAMVVQDCRGSYKSEGDFYHGVSEADDGYDTIEWISRQPWSNGKVGMTGVSYVAAVQSAAAASGTKHLSSMFHVKAPMDYYQHGFRQSGTFLLYTVPIAFMHASKTQMARQDSLLEGALIAAGENSAEWLARMPLKKGLTPLSRTPRVERWFFDMLNQTDYDEFWKSVPLWQPVEYLDQYADVPGYYVGGWYDLYREESFYPALTRLKEQPVKLLMGPWTHMGFGHVAGDVDFGAEAELSNANYQDLQVRWFNETLGGKKTGILDEPPVRIFVMGGGSGEKTSEGKLSHGGRWRNEQQWPLARAESTPFYFHHDGSLSADKPRQDNMSAMFLYDPKQPVPTIGGTSYFLAGQNPGGGWDLFVPYGPQDQRESPDYFGCGTHLPLSSRQDILVFQTPPLQEDVEVTGPLTVRLWASSSAVDTDFTAKLIDVYPPSSDYPDGYAMNLADGIIRARYRNGFEKPELLVPNEVYQISIDVFPTSNLFVKGHRIRVDISSSNYPAFDPNPNTGDPYMTGGKCIIAQNTVHLATDRPSHIVLPIVTQSTGGAENSSRSSP